MRNASLLFGICALVTLSCVPGISAAKDNCSGHYVNVGAMSVSINDDPGSPSHVLIGTCQGGVCTKRDRDGDEITTKTTYKAGDNFATWTDVSGTGKYANVKSSGWFRQTRTDGDVVVGDWGGVCQ